MAAALKIQCAIDEPGKVPMHTVIWIKNNLQHPCPKFAAPAYPIQWESILSGAMI